MLSYSIDMEAQGCEKDELRDEDSKEGEKVGEKYPFVMEEEEIQATAMEVDERETRGRLKERVGKFDWLTGFFRTEMLH